MMHMVYLSWTLTRLPEAVKGHLRSVVESTGGDPVERSVWLCSEHPALKEIRQILHAAGASEHQGDGDQRESEYFLGHRRAWEQSDLDAAEYLWLHRELDTTEPVCFFDGDVPCLDVDELRRVRRRLIGSAPLTCNNSIRIRLEREGFSNLSFVPVALKKVNYSGPKPFHEDVHDQEPWWCLSSDYELPPMSPAIQRLVRQGPDTLVPRGRDERAPVVLREPPFRDVQPRYLRSDWQRVEPFDVAASYECVGVASGHLGRMLIVSRRFYEFCNREGVKADWVPVRIDEG